MPYKNIDELPKGVKNNLPEHASEIFIAAYNNALEQYKYPAKRRGNENLEEVANKVAWSAVKSEYGQNEKTGKWQKK